MSLGSSRRKIAGLVFALSVSSASLAHAANVNGRIRGTVSDPSDAVVPGVEVTAINQATGVKFTTKTSADGSYIFQQLPIGTYNILVSAPGFSAFKATGITINIDQEFVEAVHLAVGQESQTLEVAADAVQVNTTDMQLNNYVDKTEFRELPLLGRNFFNLELILPGVQASSDRFTTSYSVNGSQSQQSEYLINGADSNDLPLNSISFTPNLDALQQFNLVTGPLNAEYDRNSGGVVSTAIIQGTNHFHGDVFEFYRDTFLNTRNYFQKTKPIYHQNIFGGTLGGPILKDKLFIFGAYQGTRARQPQTGYGSVNVPSAAQLTGDFSTVKFSNNVIPASLTIPGCTAGQTFAQCFGPAGLNGKLPTSAINPISAALLKQYVPAANNGTNAYVFNPITTTSQDQILGRIDYSLNPRNQFTFVGIYQTNPSSDVIPFTGATLPGFGDVNLSHNQQYTFDYVRQLSATAVNDFAVHYTRFNYGAVSPQNKVAPSSLGFSINPQDAANESVPYMSVAGFFALGFSTNGPQPRVDSTYQIDDNFSKTVGHHNLKFGYDGRRFNVSNPFDGNNNGNFSFSASGNPDTSGSALLDFFIGAPKTFAQGTGNNIIAKAFLNYLYAQDTWKVTNSLTLSYGIGYQIDTPLENLQHGGEGVTCFIPGQQSNVFTTAPRNLSFPGDPGCNNASGATTRYTDFGPRIGFAYAPDLGALSGGSAKKLSIRGGYGIYYNRAEEESALQNLSDPPYAVTAHGATDFGATNPQFANPYADLNIAGAAGVHPNKFPLTFPTPGAKVDFSAFEPFDLSQAAPGFRSPYAENFQLTVEREFPSQIVARVSYVGSVGRHNQITVEANPITQAGHDACLASAACINNASIQNYAYPTHTLYGYADTANGGVNEFPSIGEISTEGASNYNSLQAGLEKGMTHGLAVQASYTYSHALDNGSSFENSGFGGSRGYNQYQKSLNYGNSAYDARHRFVLAPIYSVPFKASGKAYSFRNLAAAGWQISGIATFATGFPFDISYGGGTSNSLWCSSSFSYYACPDVPVQTGALQRTSLRTADPNNGFPDAFNASTFTDEAIGSFGNIGRDIYHGPGILNTNVVVAKNIPFSSDGVRTLQLRMESDNVFNHTQFNAPDGNFGDGTPAQGGTFGQVTTAASGRQTQLAAKIYF